jgi:hypothetical protein
MSLLAPPALPPVPTAPHTRVQHIFYTAPYIKSLFQSFIEEHPSSQVLESEGFVNALSRIYVLGLAYTPDFWKGASDVPLQQNKEELIAHLNLLRKATGKLMGRRPWERFQPLWNKLTRDPLPSRKMNRVIEFNEGDAEIMVRIRLVHLVARLVEAQIHPPPRPPIIEARPKRIAGRLPRNKKTDL